MTETYSISNVNHFNGTIPILSQLKTKIFNSNITSGVLQYINRNGDSIDIIFDTNLNGGDKTTLDGIVSSYTTDVFYTGINSITPKNNTFAQSSYVRMGTIVFQGTNIQSLDKICAVSYMDSGVTDYTIRVYDFNNSQVIASQTFTNTTEEIVHLGTLSNLPESESIFEVQIKKNGGTGNKNVYCESITFYSI